MKPITPDGFERMFQANIDPWDTATSPFEAYKRRVLLRACGSRIYARGLELACANGETTRRLARRCLRLLAVDSSPTALEEAGRRTRGCRGVFLRQTLLPDEMPHGPFDLIVVSELLYYMPWRASHDLVRRIEQEVAPGGRIVVLHHTRNFDDAAQPPALAQAKALTQLARTHRRVFAHQHARFDVAAFERYRLKSPTR